MFQSFSFAPQCLKRLTVKFFLARNMNIGILKRHEISFKKLLEIAFWKEITKPMEKLRKVLAAQGVQLSLCAKSSPNQELCKIYKGFIDQRYSRKCF